MEKTNKKVIIIAVILALLTSTLIFAYLKSLQKTDKQVQYADVFVAANKIKARTIINNQDLKKIKMEKDLVNSNALTKREEIVNKTVEETIYKGEQILKERLADKDKSPLSYQIPKGKKAITIYVDEASAVGYFIKPEDFVDVIATIEPSQNQATSAISKTILQDVMVLGVGQQKNIVDKVQNKSDKKGLGDKPSGNTDSIKTVTLAVTSSDAEKIAMSEYAGTLRLTLRPVGDKSKFNSVGITRNNLVQ